ncbi:hypothetical protein M407DRAFT_155872 [Tulasnella calospora MUT 4182]|uniref:Uncharacterized protein n=1 Tax=Tulasnella calospora MUT 4182 TaxID=1051891 RepID=A0A0C3Q684_9AGAM|nr:hypothetical protein M407DRAFT_155872 [Tulasnella calospora MUT 4182]
MCGRNYKALSWNILIQSTRAISMRTGEFSIVRTVLEEELHGLEGADRARAEVAEVHRGRTTVPTPNIFRTGLAYYSAAIWAA